MRKKIRNHVALMINLGYDLATEVDLDGKDVNNDFSKGLRHEGCDLGPINCVIK